MEQELRFGLDLGWFGNFSGRFFHVCGQENVDFLSQNVPVIRHHHKCSDNNWDVYKAEINIVEAGASC